jgi:hypothetical protein
VPPSRDAVRRFTAVWAVSVVIKVVAVAVLAYFVLRYAGGFS